MGWDVGLWVALWGYGSGYGAGYGVMGWDVGMSPMTSPKGAEPTIFIGYKGGKEKGAGLPAVGGASMRGRGFMEWAWLWAVGVASGVGVAFREGVAFRSGRGFRE